MIPLPAIPTAVKTEAATAAKMVPGLEKWIIGIVSFGLGPKLASASVSSDVIFRFQTHRVTQKFQFN